jgi:hypothetical protein
VTDYLLNISPNAPTAANVEIAGRVLTPAGQGLRNAVVVLTDADGSRRSALTSSFGYYRFEDVPAGGTYVMDVRSKLFNFNSRVVQVFDNLADVDFVGSVK